MKTRRIFLTLGGGFLVVAGWRMTAPHLQDAIAGPFQFEPLPRAPGFRRVMRDGEGVSRGVIDPLVGISTNQPTRELPKPRLPIDLFGAQNAGLPVAIFSDYNCPYCRALERHLAELAPQLDLTINTLNLPLLGDASLLGAKASIAAGLQNRFDAMHKRLMDSRLVISAGYIAEIAGDLGLDVVQLQSDMETTAVAKRININRALARMLGVIGTPGTVIGHSFFAGAMSQKRIRKLIAVERN